MGLVRSVALDPASWDRCLRHLPLLSLIKTMPICASGSFLMSFPGLSVLHCHLHAHLHTTTPSSRNHLVLYVELLIQMLQHDMTYLVLCPSMSISVYPCSSKSYCLDALAARFEDSLTVALPLWPPAAVQVC